MLKSAPGTQQPQILHNHNNIYNLPVQPLSMVNFRLIESPGVILPPISTGWY